MDSDTSTIGLMADPGLPMRIAKKISGDLADKLSAGTPNQWDVEVTTERLPMDSEGDIPIFRPAPRLREAYNWDYLVYLTDLPLISDHEILLCKANTESQTAMVSLPSVGATRAAKRVQAIVVSLITAARTNFENESPEHRMQDVMGRGVTFRQRESEDTSVRIYLSGLRHRFGLLTGTIKRNRPAQLLAELTNSIALGAATGAFGIFYGSIWELAEALSSLRLFFISFAVGTLMGFWLILKNSLWVHPRDTGARWQSRMENIATIATIGIGVVLLYIVLYSVLFLLSLTVIDGGYLANELGHPVGLSDYFGLSWLSSSLGMLAGALGSNFNDPDSIREATYSKRVYQRRKLADEFERAEDSDNE